MGLNSGEDGGFLVPDIWTEQLLQVNPQQSYIRSRAMVISRDTSEGKTEIPMWRQGPGGTYTLFTFVPVQEGTAGTTNTPKMDSLTLEPQRFSANLPAVGNSLLRNQRSLMQWIQDAFRVAKAAVEEQLFLNGTAGVNPVSMLQSPCKLSVTRATPGSIVMADLQNMAVKQHNLANAIWICSQTALPQVEELRAADGTLLHMPIFYSSRLPTLGTAGGGDIILVDCSMYCILDGSISMMASQVPGFTSDTTAIRFSFWLDAAFFVHVDDPLYVEDGTLKSPMVALN
jgi:HK97 family phage major capsid protein